MKFYVSAQKWFLDILKKIQGNPTGQYTGKEQTVTYIYYIYDSSPASLTSNYLNDLLTQTRERASNLLPLINICLLFNDKIVK